MSARHFTPTLTPPFEGRTRPFLPHFARPELVKGPACGSTGSPRAGSRGQRVPVDNLTPEDRSWCMSRIRSRGMKPEMAVRSMVHRLGYRFRLHRRDLPGTPDLVLPRHRAIIFVNGCFWHWHPDPKCPIAGLPKSNLEYWKPKLERTRVRDQQHMVTLQSGGWRVLVVWECELRNPADALILINGYLSESAQR